jgi:hypothetical protein
MAESGHFDGNLFDALIYPERLGEYRISSAPIYFNATF